MAGAILSQSLSETGPCYGPALCASEARKDIFQADRCRHLWIAVLESAVDLVIGDHHLCSSVYGDRKFSQRRQACGWFRTPDFFEVCMLAGFDPHYVRDGVNRKLIEMGRERV